MTAPAHHPHESTWAPLVLRALEEDLGTGDITSQVSIAADTQGRARIEARQPLTVCGVSVAECVFEEVDPDLLVTTHCEDGESAEAGARLLSIEGSVHSILAAERTALNFMARLCGVATLTRHFVEKVRGTQAQIVDTRKTLPGWRVLDKYAVATGGGVNHRIGLFDGILLKDNHLAAAGGVEAAVKSALAQAPAHIRVQVEVQSEAEATAACDAGADFLLLDNCSPETVARIVQSLGGRALLEASGGIDLANCRAYAEAGVHRLSIGRLTHSAPSADLALEMDEGGAGP